MPNWPLFTPSGTPKLLSVMAALLRADGEQLLPALVPALALQDRLDGEVGGAGARRARDREVAEVDRLHEVGPFLRLGQVVGLHVAGVPHEAVAGERLAAVVALGIVHRVVAHLRRDGRVAGADLLQELAAGEHLEGVRGGGPEHLGAGAGGLLADVGDAGGGVLVQDLDLVVRVLRLVGLLVGGGDFLGEGRHDRHGVGGGGERQAGDGERQGADEGGLHGVPPGVDFTGFCRDSSSRFPAFPLRPWPNSFSARIRTPAPAGRASSRVSPAGILLDRTVFYPSGGGQPGDSGALVRADGSRVRIGGAVKGEAADAVLHVARARGARPGGRGGGRGRPGLGAPLPPHALPHRAAPALRRRPGPGHGRAGGRGQGPARLRHRDGEAGEGDGSRRS